MLDEHRRGLRETEKPITVPFSPQPIPTGALEYLLREQGGREAIDKLSFTANPLQSAVSP